MSILTFAIISIIKSAAVVFVLLTAVAYSVWLERKVSAHIQNRWGPTRVGPFGLLQPLADGIKFIFKEDLTQPYVYKTLYIASPIIAVVFAITAIAVHKRISRRIVQLCCRQSGSTPASSNPQGLIESSRIERHPLRARP